MIYLDHLLAATHGVLRYPGKQTRFDAFNHDSRQVIPGEMFVAVRGEHGDGHDYVRDALQNGATGLLLEARYARALTEEMSRELEGAGTAVVVVEDTRQALQQYAHQILQRWRPTVIAVTGSTGKTSTKEAFAAVLSGSFDTFKSWQNYNDLLGLPLSLGRLEPRHEYAVLEMGCDHPGEIGKLCQIVRPALGVLTNISPTQLQYFETIERLAKELGTLLAYLPRQGAGFVGDPGDYALPAGIDAPLHSCTPALAHSIEVGWSGTQCVMPVDIGRGGEHREEEMAAGVRLGSHLLGRHAVATLLAAYKVGRYCGLSVEAIQHALAEVRPMAGRLRPLAGVNGSTLLDDTHNAAPASMIAGLEALRDLTGGQRIAVLGDMLRLGAFEEEGHRLVGQKAATCVDYLITRGERAAVIAEAAQQAGLPPERVIVTSTHEDAAQVAKQLLQQPGRAEDSPAHTGHVILVKGSEETRMERVTELLMSQPEQAREQLVRQTPGWKRIVVMRPERPTWLEIDLSAIANNARQIKALVGPRVRVLASLKADAYGHGALKVARTVLHNGVSMLGVATVSEGTPLREAGITAPILVFGYVPLWQMREAVRLGLTVTLYTREAAQALARAAQALGQTTRVHVKVDTGMGRLGIRFEETTEILSLLHEIRNLPGLELEGLFTHFAMADAADLSHTHLQLTRFQHVLHIVESEGIRPPLVHACNSAATLRVPEAHFDMVRPGIALYGLDPSAEARLPEGFRAALSFKTQIAQVKIIPAGECISYGCIYTTERPTRIAVLPVGYADGFRRSPATWGRVLVAGQEAPLVGRVCMDQCMIDVTHIPQARIGDEVVLIGRQGQAALTAEQVAQRLGTVNYEVVSEILARVPRVD